MTIYRYRRPSEYLKNEIINGEIFFSPVSNMNDYYDGFIQQSLADRVDEYIEFCTKIGPEQAKEIIERGSNKTFAQKDLENRTGKDMLKWAQNILNVPGYLEESLKNLRRDFENNPEKIQKTTDIQNQNLEEMRQKTYICCFSKKKLDMSMFGYYSEDGKGVMLEYEDTKGITKEINYVDNLPLIPLLSTYEEFVKKQVFTKLKSWSHECEMRAFIYDEKQVKVNHGLKIQTIYIGPRSKEDFVQKLISWAEEARVTVKVPKVQADGKLKWYTQLN